MHVSVWSIVHHFRPVTPTARLNSTSHRPRNSPCIDISNRDYSPSASVSQRAKYNKDDTVKQGGSIGKGTSASVRSVDRVEVQKKGRKHARRSLHYDNNENIIDDATTEYVLSRKRPISPELSATEQPYKRRRTETKDCALESLGTEPLKTHGSETELKSPQKLSTVIIGRKSGQWKLSTPNREQTLTPRKDGTKLLDTPSKSVTFHDSVVGGDDDDVIGSLTPKGTPKSGRKTPKISLTPNRESPAQVSESGGKVTPRARRNICLTPKSSQKGTPDKSADAASSPARVTPQRSSARIANASSHPVSSPRRSNRATPRSEDKKKKDLPVRRLLSRSSPGTARVLRPRTPRSYKFTAVQDYVDDLYSPDAESSDEEQFDVKVTPSRKATKEVYNCCCVLYIHCTNYSTSV